MSKHQDMVAFLVRKATASRIAKKPSGTRAFFRELIRELLLRFGTHTRTSDEISQACHDAF
jgi:hypothetical protein